MSHKRGLNLQGLPNTSYYLWNRRDHIQACSAHSTRTCRNPQPWAPSSSAACRARFVRPLPAPTNTRPPCQSDRGIVVVILVVLCRYGRVHAHRVPADIIVSARLLLPTTRFHVLHSQVIRQRGTVEEAWSLTKTLAGALPGKQASFAASASARHGQRARKISPCIESLFVISFPYTCDA